MTAPVPGRHIPAPMIRKIVKGGYALDLETEGHAVVTALAEHEAQFGRRGPVDARARYIQKRLRGPAVHVTIGDDWSPAAKLGLLVGASLASWAIVFALGVLGYFLARSAF